MHEPVLVLNANFEPINICTTRRAVGLLLAGKADMVVNGRGHIRTVKQLLPRPSVIRLEAQIHRPRPHVKLTRREVFRRDNYTCQYCGKMDGGLTVDHVIPRHYGGKTTWDNIVCSCIKCNSRKANRLPHEAHMRLIRKPVRPKWRPVISLVLGNHNHEKWKDFLDVAYWNVELEE